MCTTKNGSCVHGVLVYTKKFDRDQIAQRIMGEVAQFVQKTNTPWDPFNIELVVKAQKEPKP